MVKDRSRTERGEGNGYSTDDGKGSRRRTGGHGTRSDEERRRGESGRRRGRDEKRTGRRRRNDRGQYVETVSEAEILDLLDRIPGPVLTTSDLADTFDITTEGARRKLNDLCDAGLLDRRKSGQTRVYWRAGGEQDE